MLDTCPALCSFPPLYNLKNGEKPVFVIEPFVQFRYPIYTVTTVKIYLGKRRNEVRIFHSCQLSSVNWVSFLCLMSISVNWVSLLSPCTDKRNMIFSEILWYGVVWHDMIWFISCMVWCRTIHAEQADVFYSDFDQVLELEIWSKYWKLKSSKHANHIFRPNENIQSVQIWIDVCL